MASEALKILVPHSLPHRKAKMQRWKQSLPSFRAQIVEGQSASPTHLLWDSPTAAPEVPSGTHVVTSLWLERCCAEHMHVPEHEYLVQRVNPTAASASLQKQQIPAMQQSKAQQSLAASDIQQALLWLMADGQKPSWLEQQGRPCPPMTRVMPQKPAAPTITMLMLPGLDQATLDKYENLMPNLHRLGEPKPIKEKHRATHPVQLSRSILTVRDSAQVGSKRKHSQLEQPTQAGTASQPPSKSSHTSADPSLPCSSKHNVQQAAAGAENAVTDTAENAQQRAAEDLAEVFLLEHYQTTVTQMRSCGYPLALKDADGQDVLPDGFVSTQCSGIQGSKTQRVVAVDCEMCYTQEALELARVTLVGEDEQVLLDELVLPDMPIVHYNTAFSGITPAKMQGVTTTLKDAQQHVLQFVGPNTFLVGHALDNDLKVLKLVHMMNMDTGMLYPHARWPIQQHSLRTLAQTHLQMTIQQGAHDSKEDAIAALRLVKLKQQQGPFFCVGITPGAQDLLDILVHHGRQCSMFDRPDVLGWHATQCCPGTACATDAQTVAEAISCLQSDSADFCWLQLWGLADVHESRMYGKVARSKWAYPKDQLAALPEMFVEESLQQLDAHVGQLCDALKPDSMLFVCAGPGDTTHQRRKEEAAKEARYAQQLAAATGNAKARTSVPFSSNLTASGAVLFAATKCSKSQCVFQCVLRQ